MNCNDLREEFIYGVKIEQIPSWSIFLTERLPRELEEDESVMSGYFYYREEVLVGYCLMSLMSGHTHTMHYLEISKEEQGKGVGSYIYKQMKKYYAEFILEPIGRGTYHFYLSLGAKPVCTHGGGMMLVSSQRAPSVVKEDVFGSDLSSHVPNDDFVYVRDDWLAYDKL